MQIITEIPDGKPGRPDNQRSRFLKCQPGRDLPKKTEVATGRKRNAFLTGKVSPIATDYYMENETDETETNLTTSENFDFLYRSALRYAGIIRKSKNPEKPKRKVQNPAKIRRNHNSKRLLKYKSRNIGMIKKSIGSKQIRCSFFAYRSRNIIKHYVRVMGIIVH